MIENIALGHRVLEVMLGTMFDKLWNPTEKRFLKHLCDRRIGFKELSKAHKLYLWKLYRKRLDDKVPGSAPPGACF